MDGEKPHDDGLQVEIVAGQIFDAGQPPDTGGRGAELG